MPDVETKIRGCRRPKRRNFTVSEMADVAAAAAAKSEVPLLSPDAEPAYKDEVEPTPLLFFDGHCNLCNFFVSMFLKLDAGSDPVRVKLSSLQSPEVRRSRSMPPACWCAPHARPVRGRRGTCSPGEGCGRRLSSRQETRVTRRSSSSVPQAGCTCAQRRHCRWSQKPPWPPRPLGGHALSRAAHPLSRWTSLATPLAAGAEGGGSRRAMVAVRAVHDGPVHPHMRLRG